MPNHQRDARDTVADEAQIAAFSHPTTDPIAVHARLRPQALASVDLDTGRRWTYAALDVDIQRAVAVLSAEGISEGDRVAMLGRNSVFLLILQHALMRMGAILVPLNWRLTSLELGTLVADCSPKIFYADGPAPPLPPECRSAELAALRTAVDAAAPARRLPPPSRLATCLLLYTSGTSGTPKGVRLTPQCLLATAVNLRVLIAIDSASVFLADSPMFHILGLVIQIWGPLGAGGAVLIAPRFCPAATNRRLADAALRVTHYFCVPQMAEALRAAAGFAPARWTSLRAVFTGGAPNPPARIRWWLARGVLMVDGYGGTETGTVLGMPPARDAVEAKAGSVGAPGPLTRVRIVDDRDVEVPRGTPGEIVVQGMNVTPGYWNKPAETRRAFTADGWFRTGDIGRCDEDGFVFVVDRKKDMYISGGENVYPVEVEAALVRHPGVREVAVIGVPDEEWGEVGRAFIVLEEGRRLTEGELGRHCRTLIAKYKVPNTFVFVENLPRTGSGKVKKHELRTGKLSEIEGVLNGS